MTIAHPILAADVATLDDGTQRLLAPRIGRFTPHVEAGQLVEPGELLGVLDVLHDRFRIAVPAGVAGRVRELPAGARQTPLGYGGVIAILQVADVGVDAAHPIGADTAGLDLPEGAEVFRSPMDGQFYRSPSPDEPAFAAEGQRIEPGEKLGLVEVMKFFYPLEYEGDGPRVVHRFLVDDATPLASGQPVVVLLREDS